MRDSNDDRDNDSDSDRDNNSHSDNDSNDSEAAAQIAQVAANYGFINRMQYG